MKLLSFMLTGAALLGSIAAAGAGEPRTVKLYDEVVFYDGYNDKVFDADKNDGILRHRNNLYALRLTDEQLDWFGNDLRLDVKIGALCDNYDRIGNVNLALVPKGEETYDWETLPTRIELARFITPFMNKNKRPTHVPYSYQIDADALIFRDASLREKYDFWIEFELFGIPYAANQQIAGCADRNDVFSGTLEFTCNSAAQPVTDNHVLVPIVIKRPEYKGGNLNNYQEGATDNIGRTSKTWTFEVPEDVEDARITFIISNHGANAGGEEYVRRLHGIFFDGKVVMRYTPGGVSCEPYRIYNTQGNGIYGASRDDASWEQFSNWCPGAAIPIREIDLGPIKKGTHTFRVAVPDAKFVNNQGDFPTSAYFQGVKSGKLPAGLYTPEMVEPELSFKVEGQAVVWTCSEEVADASLYTLDGKRLATVPGWDGKMDLRPYDRGIYLLNVRCTDGTTATRKFTY